MSVCVCAFDMYTDIIIYMYIHTYMYTHMCIYTFIRTAQTYIHTCLRIYIRVYIFNWYVCVSVSVFVWLWICVCFHVCVYVYVCICARVWVLIYVLREAGQWLKTTLHVAEKNKIDDLKLESLIHLACLHFYTGSLLHLAMDAGEENMALGFVRLPLQEQGVCACACVCTTHTATVRGSRICISPQMWAEQDGT